MHANGSVDEPLHASLSLTYSPSLIRENSRRGFVLPEIVAAHWGPLPALWQVQLLKLLVNAQQHTVLPDSPSTSKETCLLLQKNLPPGC